MHEKDRREKHLFGHNDVFAAFWNARIFAAPDEKISPDMLRDAPTEHISMPQGAPVKRLRDILKICDGALGLNIAFLGLENQTESDSRMPIRVMGYDWLAYDMQTRAPLAENKIYPVFTAVAYFGYKKPWNAPKTLGDLVEIPPRLKRHFNDYKVPVIEFAWLCDDEIAQLSGDLKTLAVCLRKFRLNDLKDWPDGSFAHIGEVLDLLAAITGRSLFSELKQHYSNKEGSVQMCEMFEKYENDLIAVGEKRGIAIGEERGSEKKANDIARAMIENALSDELIAKTTGISLKRIGDLRKSVMLCGGNA